MTVMSRNWEGKELEMKKHGESGAKGVVCGPFWGNQFNYLIPHISDFNNKK